VARRFIEFVNSILALVSFVVALLGIFEVVQIPQITLNLSNAQAALFAFGVYFAVTGFLVISCAWALFAAFSNVSISALVPLMVHAAFTRQISPALEPIEAVIPGAILFILIVVHAFLVPAFAEKGWGFGRLAASATGMLLAVYWYGVFNYWGELANLSL
jgi:hypothetical protein